MITTKTTGKIDSYCNQKFWWLNVDLTKKQQYSCCAATPTDVDVEWLSKNSGQLFNTPLLQQERQAMLNGDPVSSCWETCFRAESQGLVSRRILEKGNQRTHTDINVSPSLVNIVLGSTCNLTCVYCCKQYSTAWARDLEQAGPYFDDNRYKLFSNDRSKKHFDIRIDPDYQLLLDEVAKLSAATVHISGGEPFLYNNLGDLVTASTANEIKINSGLGVDPVRFRNQLQRLKDQQHVEIIVSAETVGRLYELVRYGNSFDTFETNLQTLQQSGLKYRFINVISNLTVLGMVDFYHRYQHNEFYFLLCNDPVFLGVNVLDEHTKATVIDQFQKCNHPAKHTVLENITQPTTIEQRENFAIYIKEFAARRKVSLDLLPPSLKHWINYA